MSDRDKPLILKADGQPFRGEDPFKDLDGSITGEEMSRLISDWAFEDYKSTFFEGSFDEFLQRINENPKMYLRSSFQYLFDAIRAFGVDERELEDTGETIPVYGIFDDPFTHGDKALYGLERVLHEVVSEIESTARMGQPRIILLNGPAGTAKTTIVDQIAKGMSMYSKMPDGELLTFEWDIDNERIPCLLNENPILLIPPEIREGYLREKLNFRDFRKLSWKLQNGDLCPNCRTIYETLLRGYGGDRRKVMDHVKVRRYTVAENSGYARILHAGNEKGILGPGGQSEALRKRRIQFYNFFGPYAIANRGMIHYVDIFKQRQDMDHLSTAVEEGKVAFGFISTDIDFVIFMTSNLEDYDAMKDREMSDSLRDRMHKIDVPYIMRAGEESNIYSKHLEDKHPSKHVAPHTVDTVSLWAVLTRETMPTLKGRKKARRILDERQIELFENLTPMQKVQIYDGRIGTELTSFDEEDRSKITKTFRRIVRESVDSKLGYEWDEGMFGVSPRQIQNLFKSILRTYGCLNPVDVLHKLEEIVDSGGSDYEYLEREAEIRDELKKNVEGGKIKGFNHSGAALSFARKYFHEQIRDEVGFALVGKTEHEVVDMIKNYLGAIMRVTTEESFRGGTYEQDKKALARIEDLFDVPEDAAEEFRNRMFQTYRVHVEKLSDGKNPISMENFDMKKVMRFLYIGTMKNLFDKYKDDFDWPEIRKGFARYGTEAFDDLDRGTQDKVESVINFLVDNAGYCKHCAQNTFLYADEKELFDIDREFEDAGQMMFEELEDIEITGFKS